MDNICFAHSGLSHFTSLGREQKKKKKASRCKTFLHKTRSHGQRLGLLCFNETQVVSLHKALHMPLVVAPQK